MFELVPNMDVLTTLYGITVRAAVNSFIIDRQNHDLQLLFDN